MLDFITLQTIFAYSIIVTAYSLVGGAYMNNEMLYQLFLNSLTKMNDAELEKSLSKAKNMLSDNDYAKLLEVIRMEKEKQRKNN
jgi:hypothetical protein